VPDEADWQRRARLAADALANAKADARAKGYRVPREGAVPGTAEVAAPRQGPAHVIAPAPGTPAQPDEAGPDSGEVSQASPPHSYRPRQKGRARRDDPQPLSSALDGLLRDQGWRLAAAVGSVFGRWDQLVGPDVAAHTRPERFSDGELLVIADSSAWATQVRLLAATLVRRLNTELGHGTVTRVVVRGPASPRRMGPLRVRGTRDDKGDYG
jgi:predicted nucleic acid-binding Zn ribbon protein